MLSDQIAVAVGIHPKNLSKTLLPNLVASVVSLHVLYSVNLSQHLPTALWPAGTFRVCDKNWLVRFLGEKQGIFDMPSLLGWGEASKVSLDGGIGIVDCCLFRLNHFSSL